MARMVFCERLKQEAEGLDFQLYPGELGKRILMRPLQRIPVA